MRTFQRLNSVATLARLWLWRRRHIICANYRQRVAIFSIGNDAAGSLDLLSIYDSHSVPVSARLIAPVQARAQVRNKHGPAQRLSQPQSSSSWHCSCSCSYSSPSSFSSRLHELHKSSPNCTKVCLALTPCSLLPLPL